MHTLELEGLLTILNSSQSALWFIINKVVKSWTPIIPNTQLIVSCEDSSDPNKWKLDLLVGPTKTIGILVIVLTLFLMILGLLIIIMHFAEKAEDERQQAKAFDFL